MQDNRQHSHKKVTQDIPWEILIEGKNLASKSIHHHVLFNKKPLQYNHGSLQSHSHNQEIHVNKYESTHPMPCFQPSQVLPLANLSSLIPLNSCCFFLLSSHCLATITTLVAAYIVASPTKPPSGIT